MTQRIRVAEGGFCAFTSDPYVMFPDADLALATTRKRKPEL